MKMKLKPITDAATHKAAHISIQPAGLGLHISALKASGEQVDIVVDMQTWKSFLTQTEAAARVVIESLESVNEAIKAAPAPSRFKLPGLW